MTNFHFLQTEWPLIQDESLFNYYRFLMNL